MACTDEISAGTPARRPALLLSLLLLAASVAACGESPTEVFLRARAAAEAKEQDAFLAGFTDRSGALLRGILRASAESRGRAEYLTAKDVYALLPAGDVLAEEVRDRLALLKVGRSERAFERVVLLREVDGWRVDILDSDRFWDPLMVKTQ